MKKTINVKRTCIEIFPYEPCESTKLENMLSVYDRATFSKKYMGLDYDIENEILRVPRSISVKFLEEEFDTTANIKMKKYDDYDSINFDLKVLPRNDLQRNAIAFLLSKNKYSNLEGYSRRILSLDTGDGKTYCAIASIFYSGIKTGIILNDNTLINQWKERIIQYTNLIENDIYIVSGKKSVEKILDRDKKVKNAKIFLISHRTINSFAKSNGWNSITEVFKNMKIGISIIDEAHKEFLNTVKIDLYTNTYNTFYLTATANRSDVAEDILYKRIFYNVPILNHVKNKYEKHILMNIIEYNSNPTLMDISSIKTRFGFSINNYTKYMVFGKGREHFLKILRLVINTIKEKKGKLVIYIALNDAIKDIYKYLKNEYPELKKYIGVYTTLIKDKEKKEKQLKKKIILSTSKSLGTGADIEDLRYILMCEPYSSKVTAKQVSGRLRDIGKKVYYFELVDKGFTDCARLYNAHKDELIKRAKKFNIHKL